MPRRMSSNWYRSAYFIFGFRAKSRRRLRFVDANRPRPAWIVYAPGGYAAEGRSLNGTTAVSQDKMPSRREKIIVALMGASVVLIGLGMAAMNFL